MNKVRLYSALVFVLALTYGLSACIERQQAESRGQKGRSAAKYIGDAVLLGPLDLDEPVPTRLFAASANAQGVGEPIEGQLRITVGNRDPQVRVQHSRVPGWKLFDSKMADLPPITIEIIQSGSFLIPVDRKIIISGHERWNTIFGVGSTWLEADGYSRAALPFALQQVNANCTHNGLLTFAYDADGKTSRALVQIASETCAYLQFDLWGLYDVAYESYTISDAENIRSEYLEYVSSRIPTRPIAELEILDSSIAPELIGADIAAKAMTAFGVVANGVHYVGGCVTRYGRYPYCDSLHLPSYSLAKSVFAGLAYMRIAQLYPGIKKEVISDWVPDCANIDRWRDVSFENVLDMATGNYRSAEDHEDENSLGMTRFLLAKKFQKKIKVACTMYPRKAAPGSRWVYHTSDTFILIDALQNYLDKNDVTAKDIFDDIVYEQIFRPLNMSSASASVLRTIDEKNLPLGGLGLTFLRDDLAKLSMFLQGGGLVDGRTLLDRTLLDGAMQRLSEEHGLLATNEQYRYNNGFWAWDAGTFLGCSESVWIAYMSGYGGITFALMPNGTAYYYFSDNFEFRWAAAVRESDKLRAMCKTHAPKDIEAPAKTALSKNVPLIN